MTAVSDETGRAIERMIERIRGERIVAFGETKPLSKADADLLIAGLTALSAPAMDALHHLGRALYYIAAIHPDDRNEAVESAFTFYNASVPNCKVDPLEHALLRTHQPALSAAPVGDDLAVEISTDYERGFEAGRKSWKEVIDQHLLYTAELEKKIASAPVAQEPVAWMRNAPEGDTVPVVQCDEDDDGAFPVYAGAPPATSAGAILETLREHHKWHLGSGPIGLPDGEGGWIEIDNGAEYSDSALYERTAKVLEGAPPEELQPMPRGGMNTWWWEQAVLLRRKVRALEKATPVSVGAEQIARELYKSRGMFDDKTVKLHFDWFKSDVGLAHHEARQAIIICYRDANAILSLFERVSSMDSDRIRDALKHAQTRFECLAEDFKNAGKSVDWAMCQTDADRMAAALSPSGWRSDMEIAPRDRDIDLWHRQMNKRLTDCFWSYDDSPSRAGAWFSRSGGRALNMGLDKDFSHWREIPAPPAEAERKC